MKNVIQNKTTTDLSPATLYADDDNKFSIKIGGTFFEVTIHFSVKGKQSVLEQFKNLILSEKLIG